MPSIRTTIQRDGWNQVERNYLQINSGHTNHAHRGEDQARLQIGSRSAHSSHLVLPLSTVPLNPGARAYLF